MSESRLMRVLDGGRDDDAPPFIVDRATCWNEKTRLQYGGAAGPESEACQKRKALIPANIPLHCTATTAHKETPTPSPWTTATMKAASWSKSTTNSTIPRVARSPRNPADTSSRTSCHCPGRQLTPPKRYMVRLVHTGEIPSSLTRRKDQIHAGDIDLEPEYQRGALSHHVTRFHKLWDQPVIQMSYGRNRSKLASLTRSFATFMYLPSFSVCPCSAPLSGLTTIVSRTPERGWL